jgi:hypothetical protein
MKLVEIRNGNKLTIKRVPDDWEPKDEHKDIGQRDLTTTDCKTFSFGMTEEQHRQIFGGNK